MFYRDVKFSNVYFDVMFNVYVGNFSFVFLVDYDKVVYFIVMDGIFGYMVLEIFFIGKLMMKFDVFSYGIFVFEVVCGRLFLDWYLL